jgi:hypothetical protein
MKGSYGGLSFRIEKHKHRKWEIVTHGGGFQESSFQSFYLFVIGCVLIDNANSDAQLHLDITHLAPVEGDAHTRRPLLTTLYLAAR